MKDKYYRAALKFCQEHGYEGDELPKFRLGGPPSRNCPVTVALEPFGVVASANGLAMSEINGHQEIVWDGGEKVAEFMNRADDGLYPELGRPGPEII